MAPKIKKEMQDMYINCKLLKLISQVLRYSATKIRDTGSQDPVAKFSRTGHHRDS